MSQQSDADASREARWKPDGVQKEVLKELVDEMVTEHMKMIEGQLKSRVPSEVFMEVGIAAFQVLSNHFFNLKNVVGVEDAEGS